MNNFFFKIVNLMFKDAFASIKTKRSIWIIFSSFIRILILIAVNKLLTKSLDFNNLSTYFIVISIYNFFGTIIIGPFGEYVYKIFFKINDKHDIAFFLESYYKKFIFTVALISLIILGIVIYFYFGSNNTYFIEIPILISLMIIFKSIFDSNISFINALGHFKWYSILVTFNAIIYYVLSNLLTKFLEPTYFLWIGGFIFSNIIFSFLTIYVLRISALNQISKRKFYFNSKLVKFIPSMIITNLLIWFLTDGFRFISEQKFSIENSAILILGFALASQLFSVATNFILPIFTPILLRGYSEATKNKRYIALKDYLIKTLPFLILTLIFTLIFSKNIISILVDDSKIKEELFVIFIIGLFVEFIRSILGIIKNYKISENKLIYQVYSLIVPSFLLVISAFIPINSNIIFAFYILVIYLIYFLVSIIFSLRLKNT